MTNAEIKKAFEQFKKEIKKEKGIAYGFTMNKKQIENRTATKFACYAASYDEVIEYYEHQIDKIKAYETFDDRDARIVEDYKTEIEGLRELKNRYGTRANQALALKKTIEETNAFKKFEETVGKTTLTTEIDSENCYKIRFRY